MNQERGNVLFIILIAVALFAALSYAVTSSSRSSGDNSKEEEEELEVAKVLNYLSHVSFGVTRIRASGTPLSQIDFYTNKRITSEGDVVVRDNELCIETTCEVFSADGGGVSYYAFPELGEVDPLPNGHLPSYLRPGELDAWLVNIHDVGTELPEMALIISSVKPELCEKINQKFEIPGLVTADTRARTIWHKDKADALNDTSLDPFGASASDSVLAGKRTFCARRSPPAPEGYMVIHVVEEQ